MHGVDKKIGKFLAEDDQLDSPSISYLEDPESITVQDVTAVDETTAYLEMVAEADVIVDVFVEKWDTEYLEETYALEIMEWDWNESVSWGQLNLRLPIRITMMINTSDLVVETFEVQSFDEKYGWCHHCAQPIFSDSASSCPICKKDF